jgi:hypothetical protein
LARASAFNSLARSFIAARSSAVNPRDVLVPAVPVVDVFRVFFFLGLASAIDDLPMLVS